jgi:hypothetical protein
MGLKNLVRNKSIFKITSFSTSVAIARILNSALAGNSKSCPEPVDVPLPLVARICAPIAEQN